MKTKASFFVLLTIGLLTVGLTACTSEESQGLLKAQAKISEGDARQMALAKVTNGTVKSGELEKEKGKLIWSFDIATPDSVDITEVAVDAVAGGIVSMSKETPAQQAKEADHDAKSEKK